MAELAALKMNSGTHSSKKIYDHQEFGQRYHEYLDHKSYTNKSSLYCDSNDRSNATTRRVDCCLNETPYKNTSVARTSDGLVQDVNRFIDPSNDEFKQAISLRETKDVASLEGKLGPSLSKQERSSNRVNRLKFNVFVFLQLSFAGNLIFTFVITALPVEARFPVSDCSKGRYPEQQWNSPKKLSKDHPNVLRSKFFYRYLRCCCSNIPPLYLQITLVSKNTNALYGGLGTLLFGVLATCNFVVKVPCNDQRR
ncbi:dynamin-like protein ARC5 [Artemisia annua]|uniref:Dynamin-like protein ARC5 n=1 Tax=Artemisia annua TaxID=35608 RepID=A0A2U1KTA6_ARTAN|nr:dynamin-like protein ARC5 [Artemisia annua]